MPVSGAAQDLAEGVLAGRVPAVARAITWAESGDPRFHALLALVFPRTGGARVTGLTGSPGAGKSTLTAALARRARALGRKVGIVAVDPSSPFSGGAILGDRIRMQDLYTDPGVLIRSMATRGHLGGLARASADAVDVLDAAGYDEILVETVGVGQDEVEVFRLAQTCVVVLTPGMGDDIQAIKAGLMEVADLFVVNKADRDGADRVVQEILQMLELGEHGAWLPPVVKTVATTGAGLDELAARIAEHRAFLDGPQGAARRRERTKMRIESLVKEDFLRRVERLRGGTGALEEAAARVEARMEDPVSAAHTLSGTLEKDGRSPSPSSPSKKSPVSSPALLLLIQLLRNPPFRNPRSPLSSPEFPTSASPFRRSRKAESSGISSASSRSTARRSPRKKSSRRSVRSGSRTSSSSSRRRPTGRSRKRSRSAARASTISASRSRTSAPCSRGSRRPA